MKKIIVLLFLLGGFMMSVIYAVTRWKSEIPEVEVISMEKAVYAESVTAVGEVIKQGDRFYAEVYVPENSIASVGESQDCVITGSAFADSEYSGTVEVISDTAVRRVVGTAQTTVIPVKIAIENPDSLVRTGCSVKARIYTGDKRTVDVLPYNAIDVDSDGNEYVYVFSSGVSVRKEISTGVEFSAGVEITDGISDGDYVIVSGEELSDGEYVSISEGE